MTDTDSASGHHDQGAAFHVYAVLGEELLHCRHLFVDAHFEETDDARMLKALDKNSLTEVLIFSQENPSLFAGQAQNPLIGCAWIHIPR